MRLMCETHNAPVVECPLACMTKDNMTWRDVPSLTLEEFLALQFADPAATADAADQFVRRLPVG